MTDLAAYRQLCAAKKPKALDAGIAYRAELNGTLFDHQRHGVEFALRAGRSALFYDTGLGKTAMMLEWGRVVVEHTNKPVLMLAPLAVGAQHVREAERLGIETVQSRHGLPQGAPRIVITNYERLDKFSPGDFAGVILDESSILKSFTGVTTRKLIEAFAETRFRLAGTATPAPNDHTELGQHSSFLGVMPSNEMLSRFFVTDQAEMGRYRLKKPAIRPFWDWVASWARCVSKPSDLGFSDEGFDLPPLNIERHIVSADRSIDPGAEKDGQARLFRIPDRSATAIHKEKRHTNLARAKLTAEIVYGDWACGSQNMPLGGAPNIKQAPQSASGESDRAAPERTISPTCEPTTASIRSDSGEDQNSKPGTTPSVASVTPKTPNTGKNAKRRREIATPTRSATGASLFPSGSLSPNTISLPKSKAEVARSADHLPPTSGAGVSPSTTATAPEESAASFARTATKASVNSATIPNVSSAPSPTSARDWWIVWCDTDYEQDELEKLFGTDAFSIKGSHTPERKEDYHERWLAGERKVLICKPAMFGHGLNWQHCCKMVFCGMSFSYERFYQAVRRCWRYRQLRPVTAHIVCADTELEIAAAVTRKSNDHERMKRAMADAMRRASQAHEILDPYQPHQEARFAAWLS